MTAKITLTYHISVGHQCDMLKFMLRKVYESKPLALATNCMDITKLVFLQCLVYNNLILFGINSGMMQKMIISCCCCRFIWFSCPKDWSSGRSLKVDLNNKKWQTINRASMELVWWTGVLCGRKETACSRCHWDLKFSSFLMICLATVLF